MRGVNDWAPPMAVDADGLGAGPFNRPIEPGYPVSEIQGGQPSPLPDDYVNKRSKWSLRTPQEPTQDRSLGSACVLTFRLDREIEIY